MKMSSPGGGGYGNPLKRDPEKIRRDVKDGVVSNDAAKEIYGLVIDKDGNINHEATTKLEN